VFTNLLPPNPFYYKEKTAVKVYRHNSGNHNLIFDHASNFKGNFEHPFVIYSNYVEWGVDEPISIKHFYHIPAVPCLSIPEGQKSRYPITVPVCS
jgi:hypothetical protein